MKYKKQVLWKNKYPDKKELIFDSNQRVSRALGERALSAPLALSPPKYNLSYETRVGLVHCFSGDVVARRARPCARRL